MAGNKVVIHTSSFATKSMNAILALVPRVHRIAARSWLMAASRTLEPEMRWLPVLARSDRVAVDVGANWGVYTLALSKISCEVVAFEPQPWCADGIRSARLGNVTVHQVGLSDVDGSLTLHVPVNKGVRQTGYASFEALDGEVEPVEVSVRRLDDFDLQNVGFVKIDVEGHEAAVLRGATETLGRNRPNVLVEINSQHIGETSVEAVFAQLKALAYDGFFLLDGAWRPLAEFSLREHQAAFLEGDTTAPFVYNFVFLPQESAVRLVV